MNVRSSIVDTLREVEQAIRDLQNIGVVANEPVLVNFNWPDSIEDGQQLAGSASVVIPPFSS